MTYKWEAIAQDLTEERDRLRDALEQFVGFVDAGCTEVGTIEAYRPTLVEIYKNARAALKSEKQ